MQNMKETNCSVCDLAYGDRKSWPRKDSGEGRICFGCYRVFNRRGSYERVRARPNQHLIFLQRVIADTKDLSNDSNCVIWPYGKCSYGYGNCTYLGKKHRANRLILILHTGTDPEDKVSAHFCRNTSCVSLAHLSWKTQRDNMTEDRLRDGTFPRGEQIVHSKLTEDQVRQIRLREESDAAAGRKYGVHTSTIWEIRRGLIWKHLL